LSYRYASDKLTYRILNLAERFGTAKDGKIYIRVPVTHRGLGMFVNMARESVSREIEKLVDRHLISYSRQHITIEDPEKLVKSLHETIRTDWSTILNMANPKS
jgi:CRP-like cAMP-binding protein